MLTEEMVQVSEESSKPVGCRYTKYSFMFLPGIPRKKKWAAYSRKYENALEPRNHLIMEDGFQQFQRNVYSFSRAILAGIPTGWLKATEVYSLTIMKARCPKQRCHQGHALPETCMGILCLFLVSGGLLAILTFHNL